MIIDLTPEEITVLSSFLSKISNEAYSPVLPTEKQKSKAEVKKEKFRSFAERIRLNQSKRLK